MAVDDGKIVAVGDSDQLPAAEGTIDADSIDGDYGEPPKEREVAALDD